MTDDEADEVSDYLVDPEYVPLTSCPIKVEKKGYLQDADDDYRQTDSHPRSRGIKRYERGEDPDKIGREERKMRKEQPLFEVERSLALASAQLYPPVSVCRHSSGVGREEHNDRHRRRKSAKRDEENE